MIDDKHVDTSLKYCSSASMRRMIRAICPSIPSMVLLNLITSSRNPFTSFSSNALFPSELEVLPDEEESLLADGDSSLRDFLHGGSSTSLSAAECSGTVSTSGGGCSMDTSGSVSSSAASFLTTVRVLAAHSVSLSDAVAEQTSFLKSNLKGGTAFYNDPFYFGWF